MKSRRRSLQAGREANHALVTPSSAPSDTLMWVPNLFAKGAPDDKGRQTAGFSRYFNMGRISGKLTLAQMKASFLTQAKAINAAPAGSAMNQCVEKMAQSIKGVEDVGHELQNAKPK